MMIPFEDQSLFEFGVVRELTVKAKAKPFVFMDMLPFERLGVVSVVLTTRRVSDVTDGRRADELIHDGFVFAPMGQSENLADGADVFMRFEQLRPDGVVAGHACCQLPPVLDVLQHPREQEGNRIAANLGAQRTFGAGGQVVDGCYPALVMKFAHKKIDRSISRGLWATLVAILPHASPLENGKCLLDCQISGRQVFSTGPACEAETDLQRLPLEQRDASGQSECKFDGLERRRMHLRWGHGEPS